MSAQPANAGAAGEWFNFYRFAADTAHPPPLPDGYSIEIFAPSLHRLCQSDDPAAPPFWIYLFWYFASVDRYTIFYVRHGTRIVHSSHVLSRNPKLAFMDRGDLHIGPCHTDLAYRGQKLFPATLGIVCARYPGRRFWMLAKENNIASHRGILRAGFEAVARGAKRRGRYVLSCDQPA